MKYRIATFYVSLCRKPKVMGDSDCEDRKRKNVLDT